MAKLIRKQGTSSGIVAVGDMVAVPQEDITLFEEGSIYFLAGEPGSGKTAVMLELVRVMLEGDECALPLPVLSSSDTVLFCVAEGGRALNNRFLSTFNPSVTPNVLLADYTSSVPILWRDGSVDRVVEDYYNTTLESPKLVVVDTLLRFVGGKENLYKKIEDITVALRKLQSELDNCCVVFLHHTTKSGSTYLGGVDLDANFESLKLKRTSKTSGQIEAGKLKDLTSPTVTYVLEQGAYSVRARIGGISSEEDTPQDNGLHDIVREDPSASDIAIYRRLKQNDSLTSVTPKYKLLISQARESVTDDDEDYRQAELEDRMMGFGPE